MRRDELEHVIRAAVSADLVRERIALLPLPTDRRDALAARVGAMVPGEG